MSLAKDVSGNFVVQKLFDIGGSFHKNGGMLVREVAFSGCLQPRGDPDQKKILAEKLRPEIASLSKDNYGCRVVQKAGAHLRSHVLPIWGALSMDDNARPSAPCPRTSRCSLLLLCRTTWGTASSTCSLQQNRRTKGMKLSCGEASFDPIYQHFRIVGLCSGWT